MGDVAFVVQLLGQGDYIVRARQVRRNLLNVLCDVGLGVPDVV